MKLNYPVLLLVTGGLLGASDIETGRATLKGLKGAAVLVEELNADVKQAGLTDAVIQTDVELKLRLAGIPVLSTEESFKAPGTPFLYIRLGTYLRDGLYAFAVSVSLNQEVRLHRDPSIVKFGAATWETHSVGLVGQEDMRTFVRESIKDKVDIFINAYLSVNPKK